MVSTLVGQVNLHERHRIIVNYKKYVIKKKLRCPVNTKFGGRSRVAKEKIRVNGKFVKTTKKRDGIEEEKWKFRSLVKYNEMKKVFILMHKKITKLYNIYKALINPDKNLTEHFTFYRF